MSTNLSNLTPKQRMKIVMSKLGITRKILQNAKIVKGGVEVPLFDISLATLQKVLNPKSNYPKWNHQIYDGDVTVYLHQGYSISQKTDLFTRPIETEADFLTYLYSQGSLNRNSKFVAYSAKSSQIIGHLVTQWIDAIRRWPEEFPLSKDATITGARELTSRILIEFDQSGRFPPHEMYRLALAFFETCRSCGKGSTELNEVKPLLLAIWDRRTTIESEIEDEEGYIGFLALLSRLMHCLLMSGSMEEATTIAIEIDNVLNGELRKAKSNFELIKVVARIADPLVLAGHKDYAQSLPALNTEMHGLYSRETFNSMKCQLCRSAIQNLPDFEVLEYAIREHLKRLAHFGTESFVAKSNILLAEVNFVCIFRLEHTTHGESIFVDKLRRIWMMHLDSMRVLLNSPIKRAKILYWQYLTSARLDADKEKLLVARMLLREYPHVKRLCILTDVPSFRKKLDDLILI